MTSPGFAPSDTRTAISTPPLRDGLRDDAVHAERRQRETDERGAGEERVMNSWRSRCAVMPSCSDIQSTVGGGAKFRLRSSRRSPIATACGFRAART